MADQSDKLTPETKKTSKLEDFKLFYETVDAPEYLTKKPLSEKKPPARTRRLARRRR